MATYFQGASEVQQNGLQTLSLMNPGLVGYSDVAMPAKIPLVNYNQHFLGVPLQPAPLSPDSAVISTMQELAPRIYYSLCTRNPSNNSDDSSSQPGLSLSSASFLPISRAQNGVFAFKYSKAAQELLDEVVSVRRVINESAKELSSNTDINKDGNIEDKSDARQALDLTPAEKQELQMKKAKLVILLQEVEHKYKRYKHHMQALVSSFEAAAGIGSERAYTALALKTISKQFRCLRDAISNQVRETIKNLGEEDFSEGTKSLGSRLRFVDSQLRQQRALQQFGVMRDKQWRPQRGLPEHAVSILRAWLFEHFLHPYPKNSEKTMLAKQTGVTRSQVSNWFINARVRLWKPMVEVMYSEETKEHEQDTSSDNPDAENTANNPSSNATSCHGSQTAVFSQLKKSQEHMMKIENGFSAIDDTYTIGDVPEYEQYASGFSGNGVSLNLGLSHSLTGTQPAYVSNDILHLQRRIEIGDESYDYFSIKSDNGAVFPTERDLLRSFFQTLQPESLT